MTDSIAADTEAVCERGRSVFPGTYMKVVRFSESTNSDGFIVLYLRPGGYFLFLGYWRGYERSSVAGRWVQEDGVVGLDGAGHISSDSLDSVAAPFQQSFAIQDQRRTPILVSSSEKEGWSLLSWKGPYAYVGESTVVDPDAQWLPKSLAIVDKRIEELLGGRPPHQ
jgi:hypothetical protein